MARSIFSTGGFSATPEQDATRQLIEAALQQTQQGPTFAEESTNQLIQSIMGLAAQPSVGQVTPRQTDILNRLSGLYNNFQAPNLTPGQQDIIGRTGELYNNPLGSGIFQSLLQPILAALAPSEKAQRQSLADRFRAAGQTGSGAFAQAARQQESDIFNQRGQVTSNLAMQSLQQLLGALQQGFQMGEVQRRIPLETTQALSQLLGQGFQLGETERQQSLVQPDLLIRALQAVSPIGRENLASRNPLTALSQISPIAQQTAATQNAAQSGRLLGSGTPTFSQPSSQDLFRSVGTFSPDSQAVMDFNAQNPYYAFSDVGFEPSQPVYGSDYGEWF